MKSLMIFILIGLVVFLSLSVSVLRKELLNAREHTKVIEERNNKLHRELMRLTRVNNENEKFLSELEQNIKEFESKLPFSSLEKYIPKPILNDVKPIIEKLQVFQKAREGGIPPGEEKVINSFLGGSRVMSDWSAPLECPKCGSTDTRFVEPHYEMSVYECNVCGCRFEMKEDE